VVAGSGVEPLERQTRRYEKSFSVYVRYQTKLPYSLLIYRLAIARGGAYRRASLFNPSHSGPCNALHTMESRLARWLLQARDRIDSDVLPLTQEFLSQMLGVQRPTVTLVTHQLEQEGVIQNRRGRIIIVDRKGLEKLACECYAIVRDRLSAAPPESAT
jgi:Crp-like helix-turn-helix domain